MKEFYPRKKKICQMCAGKSVDYKDQRHIAREVKRARFMGLIPFVK